MEINNYDYIQGIHPIMICPLESPTESRDFKLFMVK